MIMNAQILFLILNDILQSVLAIGLALNTDSVNLLYAIIPFVIMALVIRIVYLNLKKSYSQLNSLAVVLYVNKIIIVCLGEQYSTSILKLQLTIDLLIFLNQKKQIESLNIIVWMISTLAIVDYLKFEGNYQTYLWKLVCEILLVLIDIIISLEILKHAIKREQDSIIQQPSNNNSSERQNLSILLPIQGQNKQQQQSEDVSLLTLNRQPHNQKDYLNQEQYLIFNDNYTVKYTQIELGQYLTNNNINANTDCNYLFLFLNLPVIYKVGNSLNTSTIVEYIENNIEQLHFYQVFSVQKNVIFDFQGQIFSLSKQILQNETEYMIHFYSAPYNQNSDEQHNKELLEVCKSLSHELGTNLNSIQTFSDMGMMDENVPLIIKQKYFKPISINSEQLAFIVSNLRDFQLLNLNQFNIKLEEFDLLEEMDKVDALFQDAFANKNLQFLRELRCGSTIFYNDKQRFLQVYFQLLQNAVKFTQEGMIKVIIENKLKFCEITIIDSGIGLNDEEQKNLDFLLEFNAGVRVSSNSVGSGLGLRIANSLVNNMNGKTSNIKYQPLMQGSAFSINLRNYFVKYNSSISFEMKTNTSSIRQLSDQFYIESAITLKSKKSSMAQSISIFCEVPTIKQEASPSQIDFDSMAYDDKVNLPHLSPKFKDGITQFSIKSKCCSRVLVVDDEFFNILCIKVIMESQYQAICSTAYNGREAINQIQEKLRNPCKICQNNSFQIIFLDINMPIMDGFETVKQIKDLQQCKVISKTWCIANTGFCDLDTKMKSYDAGMDFYLTKPLDRKLLNEIIITLFPK